MDRTAVLPELSSLPTNFAPETSSHFPFLPITLMVRNQTETVEALLDTGFDGDVVLPYGLVITSTPPDGFLLWTLGDGSEVQAPAYLATVMVGSFGPFDAVISVLGDEPIVGRSLTDRFAITR